MVLDDQYGTNEILVAILTTRIARRELPVIRVKWDTLSAGRVQALKSKQRSEVSRKKKHEFCEDVDS